jgi:hypothetical protein
MAQAVSHRPFTAEDRVHTRHSIWDLWWIKWHWNILFSEFFSFPLSVLFHRGSVCSYIVWGMKSRHVGCRTSQTHSRPIDMNDNFFTGPAHHPATIQN